MNSSSDLKKILSSDLGKEKNNKIYISTDVVSQGHNAIRMGRATNLSFKERIEDYFSRVGIASLSLTIEKIKIIYEPYISEYHQEAVQVELHNTVKKTDSTPILAVMFRASDTMYMEISVNWVIFGRNQGLNNQISIKYTSSKRSNKIKLGRLRAYIEGYTQLGAKGKRPHSGGIVGMKKIDLGSYAFDMSMVRYYYPGGASKIIKDHDIQNLDAIMQWLKHNNISITRQPLINLLSGLPAEFKEIVSAIDLSNWASFIGSSSFLQYVNSAMKTCTIPSIGYLEIEEFTKDGENEKIMYFN